MSKYTIFIVIVIVIATQKTESNSKVRTYYKWKETDKMIYNEAINSAEYQVQLSDIKNNLSTSDTDINDYK